MWFALYKKEMAGFFYGYSAYFTILVYAMLSLLSALYFGMYTVTDNAGMLSYFAFQPQVLVVVVPAITMRLWAEEYKSGTIETLFTFPLSDYTLTTAKFAAGWTFATFLSLLFLPLAISSSYMITLDWGNIFSAWVGTWLAAGMLVAVGNVFSCLNTAPVAAYLTAVVAGWVVTAFKIDFAGDYFSLETMQGTFDPIEALSFSAHYENFLNGIFSIADVAYFVVTDILFLGLNMLLITYKRSR